jgi:alkyl hydroperoxide reductase subunit D
MSIEALKEKLPEYARDQRLNLAALVMDTLLSEQQRWGTLVATARASRNPKVIAAIVSEAKEHLSPEALEAAKAALAAIAATCASVWVRAFFAYGISRSIAHRSTLSAGHGL